MKFPVFWHDSETGVHVEPESASICDLAEVQKLLAPLTAADSFLGIQVEPQTVVQLLRQADGTWWLERLNTSAVVAQGTRINTAMAETLLELLFSGDVTLERFRAEFPFLEWAEVKPNTR